MLWLFVFGGVALISVVSTISYAVWLVHKASDVYSEVTMLGRRADEAAELLGMIQLPSGSHE